METFVVRIWQPAVADRDPGVEPARLRGIVEHVASGRSEAFAGPDALVALLVAALDTRPPTGSVEPLQDA